MSVVTRQKLPNLQLERDSVISEAFSASGRKIAVRLKQGVCIYDPVANEIGPPLPHTDGAEVMAFSPSEDRLALLDGKKKLTIWDLADRKAIWSRDLGPYELTSVALGERLVAGISRRQVLGWDFKLDRLVVDKALSPDAIVSVLSPNADFYVTLPARTSGEFHVHPLVPTGRIPSPIQVLSPSIDGHLQISPNGRFLLNTSSFLTVYDLDAAIEAAKARP